MLENVICFVVGMLVSAVMIHGYQRHKQREIESWLSQVKADRLTAVESLCKRRATIESAFGDSGEKLKPGGEKLEPGDRVVVTQKTLIYGVRVGDVGVVIETENKLLATVEFSWGPAIIPIVKLAKAKASVPKPEDGVDGGSGHSSIAVVTSVSLGADGLIVTYGQARAAEVLS